MNYRLIIRLLLFAVIGTVAAVFVAGCAPALTGPKYDYTSVTDPNLTPGERKAELQKMKKWRSAHGQWIEKALVRSPKKPVAAGSRILTLSEQQLVSLDWLSPNRTGARVKDKRIVAGPGVEFDIYFPSNNPGSCSLDFVSSGEGGRGTLVGTDVGDYEVFALALTLVSINGQSGPELKQKLVAGAVIGPTSKGQLSSYEPVTLGLAASEKTVIANTPVTTDKIYQIGFHIHILNPQAWDPSGSMVTLRVEPSTNCLAPTADPDR